MLLLVLLQQVKATNMTLESLLSKVGGAALQPRRRGHVYVERKCFLGLLSQLMEHHLDSGRADGRSDAVHIQNLAARDLLDRGTRARRASRPDNVVRNRHHAWLQSHPNADEDALEAELQRIRESVNEMLMARAPLDEAPRTRPGMMTKNPSGGSGLAACQSPTGRWQISWTARAVVQLAMVLQSVPTRRGGRCRKPL